MIFFKDYSQKLILSITAKISGFLSFVTNKPAAQAAGAGCMRRPFPMQLHKQAKSTYSEKIAVIF